MTAEIDETAAFEKCARALLAEGVARIDGATRSRLNRARHAALAAGPQPKRSLWRGPMLLPFTGAVAAAVVAAMFLVRGSQSHQATSQPSLEVIDLLTSGESMSLMENYDHGFYEWAAAQTAAPNGDSTSAKPTT